MLKLFKISKVILLSGMLLAFSNTFVVNNVWADVDLGSWEAARDKKDQAQKDYTKASTEYNKCAAQFGAVMCQPQQEKMAKAKADLDTATKEYNKAQKETSKKANAAEKAQNKAAAAEAKAEKKALKADEKALKNAEKALKKCQKDKDADCSAERRAVAEAQTKVNSHSKASASAAAGSSELETLNLAVDSAKDYGKKSDALNRLKAYKDNKAQAAAAAEAECTRYSAMTSKDAQAKAKQACAQAVALRQEADEAAMSYDLANTKIRETLDPSIIAAEGRLRSVGKGDTGVVDISESRTINAGKGKNDLGGYRSQYFRYDSLDAKSGGDVFDTVTRRAALAIVSLKPIVYVFAGFGLIAFAWMAIFNKISWKWFANIAMGLFLVANMGRFIEYFVAGDGDTHYYVGVWDSKTPQTGGANTLANAFKDSYYVYGDTNYNPKGLQTFDLSSKGDKSVEAVDEFKASAAGFCKGTSGSGWANFKSCLGDIVSTAKKVANTAKTVKATVEDVKARVDTVKDTVSNISQAAKAIGQGGSITDIIANAGTILNNVNNAVSTTTGAVGSLTNAASSISNNVQDMGKSTAQQRELEDRRARGEATNKFDATLKGQEWNSAAGGVENVDGKYAGENTWASKANDIAKDVKDKVGTVNSGAQEGLMQAGAVTNVIENTSFGGKTLNERRQEKQEQKAAAAHQENINRQKEEYTNSTTGINENYRQQSQQTSKLYTDIQNQQAEAKQLENQKKQAENSVKQNCSGDDDTSALCRVARETLKTAEAALTAKQDQLESTQKSYESSKKDLDAAYEKALDVNIKEAEQSYNKASERADQVCKENASSDQCAKARQDALSAASKLTGYVTEKEKKTGESRYETKEDLAKALVSDKEAQERKKAEEKLNYEMEQEKLRLENEAAAAEQEYAKANDEANNLYNQMNNQQREAAALEQEAKEKAEKANAACGKDPTSQLCAANKTAADTAKAAAENKKDQIKQTQKQYKDAKDKAESAYKNAVDSNKNQAQNDLANAKKQADEAKKQLEEANSKISDTAAEANSAKSTYTNAVSEAQSAKTAYDQAVNSGKSPDEVARLKAEYEAKLKAMNEANKTYQQKQSEYNNLQQQKQNAEKDYNEAYTKAKDAGDRLSSYTNEDVNKTGDSRLNSNENIDNQALVNQYKTETNPNAVAQASKNSYIENKNKTDVAKYTLNEKEAVAAQAKKDYEAALKKAQASGSAEDMKVAERLKKNADLANSEAEAAKKEYNSLNQKLAGYETDYLTKAVSSEEYKQKVYNSQMKQASADINKYEQAVSNQRKVVDTAATRYTQAKNSLKEGDTAGLQKAAQLYNEYKAAKEAYDTYQSYLNQSKSNYATAQSNYQSSVAEQARLQKALKGS